eukprot:6210811-Pleurochrysis_carterae.AAC.1
MVVAESEDSYFALSVAVALSMETMIAATMASPKAKGGPHDRAAMPRQHGGTQLACWVVS